MLEPRSVPLHVGFLAEYPEKTKNVPGRFRFFTLLRAFNTLAFTIEVSLAFFLGLPADFDLVFANL